MLGMRVQRGRRLVEDHKERIRAAHRPAERYLLPLAAGQVVPAGVWPADARS
jgi:hypothetical protein